jgi:hypothetical protein
VAEEIETFEVVEFTENQMGAFVFDGKELFSDDLVAVLMSDYL